MATAQAVAAMQLAVEDWQHSVSGYVKIMELERAFNDFSRSVAVQSLSLTDDDLRVRLRAHRELVHLLAYLASTDQVSAAALVDTVGKHTDALFDALSAHIAGTPLPPCRPLPLADIGTLAQWEPDAASAEGNSDAQGQVPAGRRTEGGGG
jgi:hypothetical protein